MFSPYPNRIKAKDIKGVYQKTQAPFYIYDIKSIIEQVDIIKRAFKGFTKDFSFTLRYAVKANSHSYILNLLDMKGIHFDASSIHEVVRLGHIGIQSSKVMLTSQEFSSSTQEVYQSNNFHFNATSLSQIERWGKDFPNTAISVRINPGRTSGIPGKTAVAGKNSSFGIWHTYQKEINLLAKKYNLTITKLHTHIGSGTNPKVWSLIAKYSISLLKNFPKAKTINLGGGFKVEDSLDDKPIDFSEIAKGIKNELEIFKNKYKRNIHLELEPGKFLVAKSGLLVGEVNDIVDNGEKEDVFLKLNIGMNDLIRPSLYGAQHHIDIIKNFPNASKSKKKYYLVGHCCEEGDVINPKLGKPNLKEKVLLKEAKIGDLVVLHQAGAYGRTMSSRYNSFPLISEWIRDEKGKLIEITKRESIEDLIKFEKTS